MGLRRLAALIAVVLVPAWIQADDWPGPQVQNVFSRDGTHFVRIVPGSSYGDSVGFREAGKGPYARGQFYELQADRSYRLIADVALVNPVAPVNAVVTKRGELVTFDNWHNFGFGAAIAIYGPDGALGVSYTLEKLYSPKRLAAIPRSVSSRWWRCQPLGFVDPDGETQIYVREYLGGDFVLTLSPPSFKYHPGKGTCSPPPGPFSATWFSKE